MREPFKINAFNLNNSITDFFSAYFDDQEIIADSDLRNYEVSSVMFIELSLHIQSNFDLKCNPSKLFSKQTINEITFYLLEENGLKVEDPESEIKIEHTASIQNNEIAIIGIGFKIPGAENFEQLWDILCNGQCVITEMPSGKLDWPEGINFNDEHIGINKGGFLNDVDKFDAAFFRITPREAELMDPQQRILLELTWKAIEESKQKATNYKGTKTGVYIGASGSDYDLLLQGQEGTDSLTGTGTAMALLPNRISYFFDFNGPSLLIDTACSSSLSVINEAVSAMLSGVCQEALVGAINVICHPTKSLAYDHSNMLSKDGRCYTFDSRANGYVRSEGAVVMLLKPLQKAIEDKNDIHAVIKSITINHGGQTTGLTVPSSEIQSKLIIDAYQKAKVSITEIDYIEAHGTGTSLGDPIEVSGLTSAFKQMSNAETGTQLKDLNKMNWCGIGSIKSNIGHLEAASGFAGMLKVIASMKYNAIPSTINFNTLNDKIELDNTPFYIQNKLTSWNQKKNGVERIAGVSSFGIGGANGHVVLRSYDTIIKKQSLNGQDEFDKVFILSAKKAEQLMVYAKTYITFLKNNINDLNSLCYSLQVSREEFDERLALVFNTKEELINQLTAFTNGDSISGLFKGNARVLKKNLKKQNAKDFKSHKDPENIASLWIQGADIKWLDLYDSNTTPLKINLPTYPFAKESYWLKTRKKNWLPVFGNSTLLHRKFNSLESNIFKGIFSGEELFFSQHIIKGNKVFPGVAYIEMAYSAVTELLGRRPAAASDIFWTNQIAITENVKENEILLKLIHDTNEQVILYEVITLNETLEKIHGKGKLLLSMAPDSNKLNIPFLRQRFQDFYSREECYSIFKEKGYIYGKSFQIIDKIYISNDEVLSEINAGTSSKVEEHLGKLDAALQSSIFSGLIELGSSAELPYSIKEFIQHKEIPDKYLCYVTKGENQNEENSNIERNIFFLTYEGEVICSFKGFISIPVSSDVKIKNNSISTLVLEKKEKSMVSQAFYLPVWRHLPAIDYIDKQTDTGLHLIISDTRNSNLADKIGGFLNTKKLNTAICYDIALELPVDATDIYICYSDKGNNNSTYDEYIFKCLKQILKVYNREKSLNITVFTWSTQSVFSLDKANLNGAGISGLIGSFAKEMHFWNFRVIDLQNEILDQGDLPTVLSMPFNNDGDTVAIRNGLAFKRKLSAFSVNKTVDSKFKYNGTYIIIGGAGGLGYVTTRHLVNKYNALVIWIGRSEINPAIENNLDNIEILGKRPLYFSCDATDDLKLKEVYQKIKEENLFINGLFHSAIVLNDMLVDKMSENDFKSAYETKSLVCRNMIDVFKNEKLDFACFYSSILSFLKSPGQANYASGCTFKDTYANFASQNTDVPVYVINWGYWGESGIVSSEFYQHKMADIGILSIPNDIGMEALETVLSGDNRQVVAMIVDPEKINRLGFIEENFKISEIKKETSVVLNEPLFKKYEINLKEKEQLEKICNIGILKVFVEMGVAGKRIDDIYSNEMHISLGIQEKYRKLFIELLDHLIDSGWLIADNSEIKLTEDAKDTLIEYDLELAMSALSGDESNFQSHIYLLKQCLSVYKEILTGKETATNIIFPEGDLNLVSGIYKNNYQADYFNGILSEILYHSISSPDISASKDKKIRILEVGAGTGGTSEAIFNKLKNTNLLVEYYYTDISKSFLLPVKEKYQNIAPYIVTETLDIERDIHAQSIEPYSFDVVLGTNVVHATRNIFNSLTNIKSLLKKDGLLLLNELTDKDIFNTMIFGLLDGWWLYQDTELRINGSPTLSGKSWESILEETGFINCRIFPESVDLPQHIITSISNGRINLPISNGDKKMKGHESVLKTTDMIIENSLENNSVNYLKKLFSKILKLEENKLDIELPFDLLGIDSILIGLLAKELTKDLGKISTTVFFEYRSVSELAVFLADRYKDFFNRSENLNNKASSEPFRLPKKTEPIINVQYPVDLTSQKIAANNKQYEDIAIIGLSGKYPGANNLNEFWENLKSGKDSIIEIPKERWDVLKYYDTEKGKEGVISSKHGGFLNDIDCFDPLFFNISPNEAERMDPQERLFLETVWNTIEDAGYSASQLSQRSKLKEQMRTGVYVGVMYEEYHLYGVESTLKNNPLILGWSPSSIANRVSYLLDLGGPSMAIDTMCSSSLTAIHMACNDLRMGDTDYAIAGGVNISVHPNKYLMLSHGAFLSNKGRCESFGKTGEGFVPSEGVGAVLLKRMSTALADGDRIYGVIKGTSINHGGRTKGYTVPSPIGQSNVIKEAIKKAKVNAEDFSYIEAHGTGTSLGDPIEIAGLSKAFSTSKKQFCRIGSVKSNIGHCESAAGISGLTKVLLQMKHNAYVPSLHSRELNENIDFENSPFLVQQLFEPWVASSNKPHLAGISGFGAGGSNAHIIVEEYKSPRTEIYTKQEPVVFILSAKKEERLKDYARKIKQFLISDKEVSLSDLTYTLQIGREPMNQRIAIVVDSKDVLIEQLANYVNEKEHDFLTGNIKKEKPEFSLKGGAGQAYISYAIQHREAHSLAQLWTNGIEIDWLMLYNDRKCCKVSLPTYPFARERYWIPQVKTEHISSRASQLHPLVHINTSDLSEQKYSSVFTGNESFFEDHVVRGNKILPGVAYIELAIEAGRLSTNKLINHVTEITWLAPIQVTNLKHEIHIGIFPIQNEGLAFEIYSMSDVERILHCQGKLAVCNSETIQYQEIEKIDERLLDTINQEKFYKDFKDIGILYGKSFEGVLKMKHNENEALSRIELSSEEVFLLSPNKLDSALQNIVFLNYPKQGLSLPFNLSSVKVYQKLPDKFWSYAKKNETANNSTINGYDIILFNDKGELLVEFSNFVLLPLDKKQNTFVNPGPGLQLFNYQWEEGAKKNDDANTTKREHIYLVVNTPSVFVDKLKDLVQREIKNITYKDELSFFEEVFSIVKEKLIKNPLVDFTLIIEHSSYLNLGFISALFKTAHEENPKFFGKIISVEEINLDSINEIAEIILKETESISVETKYEGKTRSIRRIKQLSHFSIKNDPIQIQPKGLYLITGGLGSLGLQFASYINKFPDTKIILTGRKSISDIIEKELSIFKNAEYVSCDVSVENEVVKLFETINKQEHKIKGIIHCAGVSKNDIIIKQEHRDFGKTLLPKINGAKLLDKYTKDEGLDFFILFSSISSSIPMAGQSDYASANRYLDLFAENRNMLLENKQRMGLTMSIGWPYWNEGGMNVDDESLVYMQKKWGMLPLPTPEGIKAFEYMLQNRIPHAIVTYGFADQIQTSLSDSKSEFKVKDTLTAKTLLDKQITHNKIEGLVLEVASRLLKLDKNQLDICEEFGNYGFDSVLLTKFSNELNKAFNLSLAPTIFYNYPTVKKVADFLTIEHPEIMNEVSEPVQKNAAPQAEIVTQKNKPLEKVIIEVASKLLKLNEANFDTNEEFGNYGFDSVLLTRFSNEINKKFNLSLAPTVFYNYPTVKKLVEFLQEEYPDIFRISEVFVESKKLVNEFTDGTIKHVEYNKRFLPNESKVKAEKAQPALLNENNEAVAIIGINGKFPGSKDVQDFWKNILSEKDLIIEVPEDRWDWKKYYGDPKQDKSKTYSKSGGFIEDVDKFDPLFFNISPSEAEMMDPQHRLTLEAVVGALDDAAVPYTKIRGSNTGVFIGVMNNDYSVILNEQEGMSCEAQFLTGTANSVLTNRISYWLDLHGPSAPVDTGCSSSLIAIHRSVQNIQSGQCEMAIAGGVNIILTPERTLSFTQAGLLSPEGKCKNFDKDANGFVRGEGVCIFILKKLSLAERDGDHIYAVIKGSAENHGGKANTLSSPNPIAQKNLILNAFKSAKVNPLDVTYIETGSTATAFGDSIEIEGLKAAYKELLGKDGEIKANNPYCVIGSVKPNVGHLEAVSGMVGLVKILFLMKNKILLRSLNLKEENDFFKLEQTPFQILKETKEWEVKKNQSRIAGISSFGFGGSNAHLIIEEYKPFNVNKFENNEPVIILLSAKNEERLKAYVLKLKEFLIADNNVSIYDVSYTLQTGREHMEERLAFVVRDKEELLVKLSEYYDGKKQGAINGNIKKEKANFLLEGGAGQAYITYAIAQRESLSLAQLWVKGIEIDWMMMYSDNKPNRISLPPYQFTRDRYWVANKKMDVIAINQAISAVNIKEFTASKDIETNSNETLPGITNQIIVPVTDKKTQEIVIELLGKLLKINPAHIDVDLNFIEYGVESVFTMKILSEFENIFELKPDPTILIKFPTIRLLSEYLDNKRIVINNSALIVPQRELIQINSKEKNVIEKTEVQPIVRKGVAIIAVACRFNDIHNPSEYWHYLSRNSVKGVADNRTHTENIKHLAYFDSKYFNFSDSEAQLMEPEKRMMLELTRELIANAGYQKDEIKDSKTGVYINMNKSGYKKPDGEKIRRVSGSSEKNDLVFNKDIATIISEFYSLKGTNFCEESEATSSLASVCLAAKDIISGKITSAIVGGISLNIQELKKQPKSKLNKGDQEIMNHVDIDSNLINNNGAGLILLKDLNAAIMDGEIILGEIDEKMIIDSNELLLKDEKVNLNQKGEIMINELNTICSVELIDSGSVNNVQSLINRFNKILPEKLYEENINYGYTNGSIGDIKAASGIAGLIKIILQIQNKTLLPSVLKEHVVGRRSSTDDHKSEGLSFIKEKMTSLICDVSLKGENLILGICSSDFSKSPKKRQPLSVKRLSNNFFWIKHEVNSKTKNSQKQKTPINS